MRRRGQHTRYDAAFYVPWISALLVPGSGPVGGAEMQMHTLTRMLAARGYRICTVVYDVPGLPAAEDGVDYVPRRPRIGGAGPGDKAAEMLAIWRALAPIEAGVFVKRVFGADTGLVALAAKAKRRPFVYSSANVIDFKLERLERKRANVALFHLGVRLADRIVVQTGEQIGLCEGRFGRTPVLIRSFAEPPMSAPAGSRETFLWIGRVTPYKQPLQFVELAKALPEASFTMVAVPVGGPSGGLEREVHEVAGAIPNLRLVPPLPRRRLMALMESALAVVNTADYEGMPNIFLEGWARGVQALALSHDPDGLIRRERLGGFADGSFDRFVELAREMWRGRDDGHDAARRCRDYVRREHSPEAVTERWIDVLQLQPRRARTAAC